ncbi:MAG: electron transporter RnfB, partial [Deltaproteobacteria bacterium]|nr:electron transporter RnfB [Deltaproteobacteria bacterium]
MELGEPDASGRRRPVSIEGSETLMEIDMLITAIGQTPDVSFTGGDSATGPSLVVTAIGGGRRAAASIHQYLSGEPVKPPEKSLFQKHIAESIFDSVKGIKKSHRAEMPELEVEEMIKSMDEVDLVLDEKNARKESKRCLSCCRLCYNRDEMAIGS